MFNKLEQVAVQEPWYKGRVVIGGDAAHAGAPTLAQGAAMAIEDAIVLAEELKITATSKPHFMRITKEEPQERSKSRTSLQKSSAAG
ncbi:monooxygenase; putative salicylate 1-monooxygenase [Bacillus spizizenii]|nr:monooxygenase; putative salicylate 1-monooxygenase [Bacillus spizizenii]